MVKTLIVGELTIKRKHVGVQTTILFPDGNSIDQSSLETISDSCLRNISKTPSLGLNRCLNKHRYVNTDHYAH